jgi:hypothetical protein
MLRKTILGFALAWAGLAFLGEMSRAVGEYDRRESRIAGRPEEWRPGMPQPARLERCLAKVREIVPPGSVVAFEAPGPEGARFFAWRWASYLLPEHDVAPLSDAQTDDLAQYFVTYAVRVEDPRIELIRRLPGCRLYRVNHP